MPTYNTPGVYIEEISTLPASVAQVPSAIPAFLGVTEKVPQDLAGNSISGFVKIKSLVDYQAKFGGTVAPDSESNGTSYLFTSIRLFYSNGGGDAYIYSAATTVAGATVQSYLDGLELLKKEPEPTLILFPDAVRLTVDKGLANVQQAALTLCDTMGNRFCILDMPTDDAMLKNGGAFRDQIGMNHLSYGAAYGPWLNVISQEGKAAAQRAVDAARLVEKAAIAEAAAASHAAEDLQKTDAELITEVAEATAKKTAATIALKAATDADASLLALKAELALATKNKTGVDDAKKNLLDATNLAATIEACETDLEAANEKLKTATDEQAARVKDSAHKDDTAAQKKAKEALDKANALLAKASAAVAVAKSGLGPLTVPASGAVAGVYAAVDASRGVWKAPANVSLSSVLSVTEVINDHDQEQLNIDVDAGKSINAIRAFPGKGILIWGARTLNGNSEEWRYVPVRRLFIMVEESIRRATAYVVFEPNDAHTWIMVKAMIENFLNELWKQGALAGSKPEQAFFVNVGLGTSMTAEDILSGRLIINVGMAAVRPAEFVIIRFSHLLQQA